MARASKTSIAVKNFVFAVAVAVAVAVSVAAAVAVVVVVVVVVGYNSAFALFFTVLTPLDIWNSNKRTRHCNRNSSNSCGNS